MRQMVAKALRTHHSCHIVDGRAEATTLPDRSIDLITVAQSIHWFEPEPTKAEFLRILKPGGWLAVLRNYGTDDGLGQALREALPDDKDLDTVALMRGRGTPMSLYYGGDAFLRRTFAFTTRQSWPELIGALGTASDAPDEDDPRYAGFERFSSGGMLESHATTELYLGRMAGAGERDEPAGSHA
jgi:SAM-dependent methyltransferase